PGDVDEFEVTDSVLSSATGATHIYLRQKHQGLPVYNGQLQIHITRDSRILSITNTFMPNLRASRRSTGAAINAAQAVSSVARHLNIQVDTPPRTMGEPLGLQRVTPLVADQILPVLEEGTDRLGREFMDRLFQGVITTLNGPAAKAQALDLASAIERSFGEKNVLINLKNPDSQRAIAQIGWAGELDRSGLPEDRDRVIPIDSNVGWSKVDRNIRRTLD
ncbi:MAG: hypothetical protein IH868_01850, partial [Chloroflexi bacterium]|nr:hypothetical protein [Chloroflexota bacterium]